MRSFFLLWTIVTTLVLNAQTPYDFPNTFSDPLTFKLHQLDKSTLSFVKKNKIKCVVRENENPTMKDRSSKIKYFFNESGLMDSLKHFSDADMSDQLAQLVYYFEYDFQQRLTKRTTTIYFGKDPIVFIEVLKYRKNGALATVSKLGEVMIDNTPRMVPSFSIVYDSTIGNMDRYKVSYPVTSNGSSNGHVHSNSNRPTYYYWYMDGKLTLQGTDSIYKYVEVKESNMGFEVSNFKYQKGARQLVAINEYDTRWQPLLIQKITIDSGKVIRKVLEENRYDNKNRLILKMEYSGILDTVPTTTTFFRNSSTGQLEKESAYTKGFIDKGAIKNMPLPPVIYNYRYYKEIPD